MTTESSSTPKEVSASPAPSKTFAFLALAAGIGLVLSFVLALVQWLQEEQAKRLFIGLDGMNTYLAIGGVACIVVGFALVRSKPSLRSLALGVAVTVAIGFGTSKLIRVDGYYGNRTPRITWSWSPRAESKLEAYLASNHRTHSPASLQFELTPSENDFSELLGRDRSGRIDRISLETNWIEHQPVVLWRHPVGLGWSSFATVGSIGVTLEQRDELECVVCYDLYTGVELWCHGEQVRFRHEYGDGPRSTPTIVGGQVFSMGATGVLTCVHVRSGKLIWKQTVFSDPAKQNLIFGMTGSPLVIEGLVVVTPGAEASGAAIAYAADTGDEVWRTGDDPASYASPVAMKLDGVLQILSFNGAGLRSYSPQGESMWLQPWVTQGDSRVNVAQPILISIAEELRSANILVSSGYDKGTALLKITHLETSWGSEVVWESKHLKSKLSNVVVRGGFVYGLDNGILACIDLKNGQRAWKGGRYGHGKILLVQDKLLIQAESGEIVLVEATDKEHRELSRYEALSNKTWNYMALAGDVLVVRNDREAAAIRLPMFNPRSAGSRY